VDLLFDIRPGLAAFPLLPAQRVPYDNDESLRTASRRPAAGTIGHMHPSRPVLGRALLLGRALDK